jgi:hypothetical protein
MSNIDKLLKDAQLKEAQRQFEANIIDENVAETIADFAQFDGKPMTDPYSQGWNTLSVNTSLYTGSTANSIDISFDGGSTVWTTVTSHADIFVDGRGIGNLYYKARFYEHEGHTTWFHVTASTAYELMRKLGLHKILAS